MNPLLYIICLAVIYPETTRYNDYSDLFETKILEILYIKHGKEKVDFSIGVYQMKPSFFEKVEEFQRKYKIKEYDFIKYPWYFSAKDKRKERLSRMKSKQWQLNYAQLYIEIAEIKFKSQGFKNDEEKVLFYAAAYNYGFTRQIEEIRKHIHRKSFPVEGFMNRDKQSYAEMALCYYEQNHCKIENQLLCKQFVY